MTAEKLDKHIALTRRDLAMMLLMRGIVNWMHEAMSEHKKALFENVLRGDLWILKQRNHQFSDLPGIRVRWEHASPKLQWDDEDDSGEDKVRDVGIEPTP